MWSLGSALGKDHIGKCEKARGGGMEHWNGDGSGNHIVCRMFEEIGACQSRNRTH